VDVEGPPLNEEQLAQMVGTLGAYRLAVIEPRQEFRARLCTGCREQGVVVYICSDGKGHWDGARLTSPYARYPLSEQTMRTADHTEVLLRLRGYIAPEVYSEHQRNPAYLSVPVTRIRTWAGAAPVAGQKLGHGLRSVSSKMRAGRRRDTRTLIR
jgi:hypothetical protein